jgi:hypothetical protein
LYTVVVVSPPRAYVAQLPLRMPKRVESSDVAFTDVT